MADGIKRVIVLLGDLLAVHLAVVVAFWVRFLGRPPAYNLDAYWRLAPWLSLVALVLLASFDLYEERWIPDQELRRRLTPTVALIASISVVISYLLGNLGFPRSVLVVSVLFSWPLLYGWRRLVLHWRYEQQPTHIVWIGSPPGPEDLHPILQWGYRPTVTVVAPACFQAGVTADLLVVGEEVEPEVKAEVFLDALSRHIPCIFKPSLLESLVAQASLVVSGQTPYLRLKPVELPWLNRWAKRLFDLAAASVLSLLLLPLGAAIALAIYLDDGRPVFYRQERVSLHGTPFWLWKFRTLERDHESKRGAGLTLPHDDGVTRVGRWLRISHLDEIPQLWNVLRGEMSLVGPRPERPHLVQGFSERHRGYPLRHHVPPGLTGLAQVQGHYLSSPEEKLQMDLTYVRSHSLWADLKILLRTISHLWHRPPDPPSSSLSS
ncbi:MAG: exopolysaccharide biosynthesis polyprenyl glycosylphosphotransferase [Firmicutes bacterium]|nr:exopolysaccharide biosynthesis polyprenyl glycosylphosphotransferase [Bacillota bacterium]